MRQVFRLMAMPDKVIAFDELPARLLVGFELCKTDGFPRHWKDWMGKIKREIIVPPEKDFLTGQVRYFKPIVEEDSYFYLVDWTLNPCVEKWQEVCDFVKRVVDKNFRLMEKIDDMAKPLAPNKSDGVTLEPEEVVVIPIPVEFQEKTVKLVTPQEEKKEEIVPHGTLEKVVDNVLKCQECGREFKGSYAKNGFRMHQKKHQKVAA